MTGTSSIDRGLTIGPTTPGGTRSMLAASFWFNRTSDRSSSSPTRKRTTTIDRPGLDVEYRYSTPGTSHSSFSMGRVTRCSTSAADAPGMSTNTSIMGTMICGSSSRGSAITAKAPSAIEATMKSGVKREFANAAARRPAAPSGFIGALRSRWPPALRCPHQTPAPRRAAWAADPR